MKTGFPAENRLRAAEQFKEVLDEGVHFPSQNFVFAVRKNLVSGKKVGVSVGRRVGGAVLRNKIKRWVREVFRLHKNSFSPGFHLVLLVREKQQLKNYQDVEKELLSLFRQSGIVKRAIGV